MFTLLLRFTDWRIRHISNKNFVILLSILIGLLAAFAAVIMKSLVAYIEHLLSAYINQTYHNYIYFLLPLIGIVLTVVYVQVFLGGKLGRGISSILYAISRKKGEIPPDKTYSHIITSAFTIGFGGSAGLEAPIVVTGSAIGSNVATLLRLSSKERILLLACGTSAGVAAIFNSPIAGVIFAIEVLLIELTVPAFIPLLISSASATLVSTILHSRQLFHLITSGYALDAIPFYIILGVFSGLVSVYVSRVTLSTEGWLNARKGSYNRAILGGLVLGVMIFVLPPLFGEGYNTIQSLFEKDYTSLLNSSMFYPLKEYDWFLLLFAGVLILVKVFATAVTISSGGNGGVFATSMLTGALSGFFYSFGINLATGIGLNQTNFVAVGMAGILSGVIHAPLTAIFLIAEITGGYVLFVPLMIVSALSYFIAKYLEPHTIYTKMLAEKGHLVDANKDKAVLGLLDLRKVLENDFVALETDQCLRDVVSAISQSRRNIFPVLSPEGKLEGVLHLNHVRSLIFEADKYDCVWVKELMEKNFAYANIGENMESVLKKFEEFHVFNLPVVENGVYKGFISKSNIFTIYRSLLIEQTEPLGTW